MTPRIVLLALAALGSLAGGRADVKAAFGTISKKDVEAHVIELAAPELEGRDSPSEGLERAAEYIAAHFAAAGLESPEGLRDYRQPFQFELRAVPVPGRCYLRTSREGSDGPPYQLEEDFVPVRGCRGEGEGPAVFVGFGIRDKKARFDELKGAKLAGAVAVLIEGEPAHKKLFDGPDEVTDAANLYAKLKELKDERVAGVLVVRRSPEPTEGADGKPLAPPELGYRYTRAFWNPATTKGGRGFRAEFEFPVLEISEQVAADILGEDVAQLAKAIEKKGKAKKPVRTEVVVTLGAELDGSTVTIHNVVGVLRGSDAALADEYVVIGAHYDHIGVDARGRIGFGADDNASGTAAVIELAQAFSAAKPRRSLVFAAFGAEEDGLIGSKAFCDDAAVPREAIVAMLNMDMIGRGKTDEVVVLGTKQNPALGKVLKEAKKLQDTRLKKVTTGKAEHLWERSDHFPFHEAGIPVLFFFEAVSEMDNEDYHTYRDTIDKLDLEKVTRTTRFVFNTAWLLANDDDRPPPPR